jgi:plastocyanin
MTVFYRARTFTVAMCVASIVAACGGGSEQPAMSGTPAPVTNPVDPATAGSVSGTVTLMGTAPAGQPINMSSDPYCVEQGGGTTQTVVVGNGNTLQNVFVYVKDGLGNLKFPVPQTAVVLDQQKCTYQPRVFGIQSGQTLEIVNSDNTLHNIHAMPQANREFNRGQALQGMKHTHVFSVAEVMVPFKCDVHKWMNAWVGVLEHPFYSVTGATGAFDLKGLPPGTYTIEAWHEKLGTQTQTVVIGAKEAKSIAFVF